MQVAIIVEQNECKIYKRLRISMFEHFRQFFANERNRTAILLIIGLLIFVAVLKHFGLYEEFGNNTCKSIRESSMLHVYSWGKILFILFS